MSKQLSMVSEFFHLIAALFLVSLPIHGYGTRIIDLLMFLITRGRTILIKLKKRARTSVIELEHVMIKIIRENEEILVTAVITKHTIAL